MLDLKQIKAHFDADDSLFDDERAMINGMIAEIERLRSLFEDEKRACDLALAEEKKLRTEFAKARDALINCLCGYCQKGDVSRKALRSIDESGLLK